MTSTPPTPSSGMPTANGSSRCRASTASHLELLRGIDRVRDILLENTLRFAAGLPANNALLWGARGMGKSSLVKAAHAAVNETRPAWPAARADRDPSRGHHEPAAAADAAARQRAALPDVLRRSVVRAAGHQLQVAEIGARRRDRGTARQCRVLCHLEPPPSDAARHDRERALDRDQPVRGGRGESLAVRPFRPVARLSQLRPGDLSRDRARLCRALRPRPRRRISCGPRPANGRSPAARARAASPGSSSRISPAGSASRSPDRQPWCGGSPALGNGTRNWRGSTGCSPRRNSKWSCGSPTPPVAPTLAITCPRLTLSPRLTSSLSQCA